jgi:hypothetical protein
MNAEQWLLDLFAAPSGGPAEPCPSIVTPSNVTPSKPRCTRCGGLGRISAYAHIRGGACYACTNAGNFNAEAKLLKRQANLTRED